MKVDSAKPSQESNVPESLRYSQMPRHLISDAHEWINEIPTVPIYYLAKKSAAVLAVSMSDGRDLENQAEGYGGVASACTHIRSRSPR